MDRKGLVGLAKFGVAVCLLVTLAALVLISSVPVSSFLSSYSRTFNITSNAVVINWTGPANITASVFANDLQLQVANGSTWIYGIYWQNDTYAENSYENFTTTANQQKCFFTIGTNKYMGFTVQNNVTGNQTSMNLTNTSQIMNSTMFTLTYYEICPPGTYYGNFSAIDAYNITEHANVTATIIIPMSMQNTLNATNWNYTGFVNGQMPPNASYYHSYYFNITELRSATGLTINLSGFTKTLGMYLFYGNNTPMAQCENTSSCEIPFIQIANTTNLSYETGNMLELRVYGNFSAGSSDTYHVNFYYTTINITNDASSPISILDFGTIQPNISSATKNFILTNVGGANYSNINQTVDFYWTKEWLNLSGDQAQNGTQSNLSIIVPNFTSQIEVSLQWRDTRNSSVFTKMTTWDVFLSDPSGTIMASSLNGSINSLFANATATEWLQYSGGFNTSNAGIWNITVNSSIAPNNLTPYNVSVKMRFNVTGPTTWIRTNFTEVSPYNTLNASGLANFTRNVTVNITVPATQLLNGTYGGFIQYSNSGAGGGWRLRIPVSFQINVPVLVINNTIYSSSITINENTGINTSRFLNVSLSNMGGASFMFQISNSSNLSMGGSIINFTIDSAWLNASVGVIQPSENRSIDISLRIITNYTGNNVGVYAGWITFNITQSSTNNISIHNIFNVSIFVNLTSNLVVNITRYLTDPVTMARNPFINVSGRTQNITMWVNVSLQNGAIISNDTVPMNASNFTSISLRESNVTTYSVSLTNIRSVFANDNNPCLAGGLCAINATIPANIPGGRYNLITSVQWNSINAGGGYNPVVLSGSGGTYPLTIWAPGIQLNSITGGSLSMGEAATSYYNTSFTNYGPMPGTGKIYMNEVCSHITITADGGYGNLNGSCTTTPSSSANYFIVTIPGNGTSCFATFKVVSANVSSGQTCYSGTSGDVNITTDMLSFNNVTGISIGVSDTDGTSGGTGTVTGNTLIPAYTYNMSVKITSYTSAFSAKAGENISATVTVKNTGNTTSIIWLTATTNNSGIITAVGPTFASLAPAVTGTYTVYMNVSNSSRLGLAAGTFKAYVEGYADTWYDTKPFGFTVMSTPEREAEINLSFANYTAQLANLTVIFNAIKASGLVDIGNLTRVGELLNASSDVLQSINGAINASNYAAAETLMIDLAGRLARIQTELAALGASKSAGEQKFFGDVYVWVVIGLVIAGAAGVVIYMMLPPKPGSGFRRIKGLKIKPHPQQEKVKKTGNGPGVFGKLKGKFKGREKGSMGDADAIKRQVGDISDYAEMKGGKIEYLTAKYSEGYERTLDKKGRKSIARKLGLIRFRKPQKKLDSFAKK